MTAPTKPCSLVRAASRLRVKTRRKRVQRRLGGLVADIVPGPHRLISASADAAVFSGHLAHGEPVIVKVATSQPSIAQLKHETRSLDELNSLVELQAWRSHVARVVDKGARPGAAWLVQSRVAGVTEIPDHLSSSGVITKAIDALVPVHRATLVEASTTGIPAEGIVAAPIRTLQRRRPRHQLELGRVAAELEECLRADPLVLARLHGDFAPTNLLWDAPTADVCGIVDWELAADALPPEIDFAHFAISLLANDHRCEYGGVVAWLLDPGNSSELVRLALDAGPNGLDTRTAVTLAWLHHVSFGLNKSVGYRRHPIWLRNNVDQVVAKL